MKKRKVTRLSGSTLVRQLFDPVSSTFTYLVIDSKTREAAIIDPVLENCDRDLKLISELKLKLRWVIDTHLHADHVTAAGLIRKKTGAKTAIGKNAGVECVDRKLSDGDAVAIGASKLRCLETPGHTKSCISLLGDGFVMTGDSLLVRACGRTDFQEGSSSTLYKSIMTKLFKLPKETVLYPGHDYKVVTSSTIGEERQCNPRIRDGVSEKKFAATMAALKLDPPKKIAEALPANLRCGLVSGVV